jgi:AraC family transcriptional regulator, transcriptional activator of pobA
MLHLRGGTAEVLVDGALSVLQPGSLLLVPQLCVHGFRFEQDAQGHVLTLAYPLIQRLARQAGDSLAALAGPHVLPIGDDGENGWLSASFAALEAEYHGNAPWRGLQVEAILAGILIVAGRRCAETAAPSSGARRGTESFPAFCELIGRHHTEHRPVSFYADRLGITAAHLNTLCRQAVGKSALELVHERVILEAKRNLVYSPMTISSVSYAAGFEDPAYFTRFFKREVGMSPRAFRDQAVSLAA